MSARVSLLVPCRTDEPALGRTLESAWASWLAVPATGERPFEVVVCLNGPDVDACPALRDFERFAAARGATVGRSDADAPAAAAGSGVLHLRALYSRRAGKPIAWNALRRHASGEAALFLDADVSFAAETFGLLLAALAGHPDAVIASPKTACAPRPTAFEAVMAAPYGVDFPNTSGQLYAARLAGLPATMPEDLIEPERWLELVVGRERVVRVPEARVVVRLPGTLADFFRQRVRIEMGKVQLHHDYPGLVRRGNPQPRTRAALASLGPANLARLAVYLALREVAHAMAWWRFRRGRTEGIWRQATSTKRWDAA